MILYTDLDILEVDLRLLTEVDNGAKEIEQTFTHKGEREGGEREREGERKREERGERERG